VTATYRENLDVDERIPPLMTRIELPELEEHVLAFVPDVVVRGKDEPASEGFLAGRIAMGGPLCVAITPASAYAACNSELRAFVEQEAGRFAYHLVHMSITFAAEPEKPWLERVTVNVTLSADGDAPIAWSMNPLRASATSTVRTSVEFAPTLKLGDVVEVGLGSAGRERERSVEDSHLVAENQMRSDPRWVFKRTKSQALRGSQRLVLVVRAPWQAEARLTGEVTAATLRHTFLRRERAELPGPLTFRAEF
jgi:hypothetical protein